MLVTLGWLVLAGLTHPVRPVPIVPQAPPPSHHFVGGSRVALWTDRDDPYHRGEGARVYLQLDRPAFVTVFRVDTDGRLRVIFPREPWSDPYIRGDRAPIELPGNRGGRSFIVDDYPGVGYLFAIASPEPFDYDPIARGDYWDYRLIDGGRIQRDPYVVLTDLAQRIAPVGGYDYDVVPYYVERHYDYPRFVCYDCHAYAGYDQWNPYSRSCTRFDLVVYDDPRYYPYRSGRGRNVVITRQAHPGPRFVFRDATPGRDSVTRVVRSGRTDDQPRGRGGAEGRSSLDVGGPGSVPTPGAQPHGAPGVGRPALAPGQRIVEDRRGTERPDSESPTRGGHDAAPERVREPTPSTTTRPSPSVRQSPKPRSTGEPELRRRKP